MSFFFISHLLLSAASFMFHQAAVFYLLVFIFVFAPLRLYMFDCNFFPSVVNVLLLIIKRELLSLNSELIVFNGSGAEYVRKEVPLYVLPASSLIKLDSPLTSFTDLQRVLYEEEQAAYNQAILQNMRC